MLPSPTREQRPGHLEVSALWFWVLIPVAYWARNLDYRLATHVCGGTGVG